MDTNIGSSIGTSTDFVYRYVLGSVYWFIVQGSWARFTCPLLAFIGASIGGGASIRASIASIRSYIPGSGGHPCPTSLNKGAVATV